MDGLACPTAQVHAAATLAPPAVDDPHANPSPTRRANALAGDELLVADDHANRPIRIGRQADLRRRTRLACAVVRARPPRAARTRRAEHGQRDRERDASPRHDPVADWMTVAKGRKRKNHGVRSGAGELAWDLLSHRVPDRALRIAKLRECWPTIATQGVARMAWPADIVHGELILHVQDNQWLHELTYLRQDLLARIRAGCPAAKIESLRIRLGAVPGTPTARGEPAPAVEPGRDVLPAQPSADTLSALEDVGDPDLREVIAGARVALSRR